MAQWSGQYMGGTHATRVATAEAALQRAVEAHLAAPADERAQTRNNLLRLAERVVALRLRMLKARLVALVAAERVDVGRVSRKGERARDESRADPSTSISALRAREELLRSGGVDSVLREFGVEGGLL